jgi:hypothetical protein
MALDDPEGWAMYDAIEAASRLTGNSPAHLTRDRNLEVNASRLARR